MAYAPDSGIQNSSTAGFCPGSIRLNGCVLLRQSACKQSSILKMGILEIRQPSIHQLGLHDAASMDLR